MKWKKSHNFGGFVVGEYFALTGARLSGGEVVAAGLATHLVPLDVSLNLRIIKDCFKDILLKCGD